MLASWDGHLSPMYILPGCPCGAQHQPTLSPCPVKVHVTQVNLMWPPLGCVIRGPSPRGWGNAFPRTSSTFIFLQLKVVLQAKPCKGGCCNLEGWSRHLHVPQTQKTTYICLQEVLWPRPTRFAYDSHTVRRMFKNLVSPDSLNGAESLCNWLRPLLHRKFFR